MLDAVAPVQRFDALDALVAQERLVAQRDQEARARVALGEGAERVEIEMVVVVV